MTRLKYFNKVNALAPPPDLYIFLHFIKLTVNKYDAGQDSIIAVKPWYCAKNAPVWVFVSYLYHISHEQYYTSADLVPNITSLNVILYNSSVNKKLILCYVLNTILCVFAQFCREHITFQGIRIVACIQATQLSFWMNPRFERIVWTNDSKASS